jgi:hypothetical protein
MSMKMFRCDEYEDVPMYEYEDVPMYEYEDVPI